MFGTYFYNKNIRNIVILFGTVFNDISVRRVNSSNVVQEEFKVPIAYGPSEKFLVRLRQATDISKGKVGLTLPRMSFEFTSITYDPARKLQTTKRHKAIKSLGTVEGINLVSGGSGTFSIDEAIYQGPSLANSTAKGIVVSWTAATRTLRANDTSGTFVVGTDITGDTSNAVWTLTSFDDQALPTTPFADNVEFETEADAILDFSESNPFGEVT